MTTLLNLLRNLRIPHVILMWAAASIVYFFVSDIAWWKASVFWAIFLGICYGLSRLALRKRGSGVVALASLAVATSALAGPLPPPKGLGLVNWTAEYGAVVEEIDTALGPAVRMELEVGPEDIQVEKDAPQNFLLDNADPIPLWMIIVSPNHWETFIFIGSPLRWDVDVYRAKMIPRPSTRGKSTVYIPTPQAIMSTKSVMAYQDFQTLMLYGPEALGNNIYNECGANDADVVWGDIESQVVVQVLSESSTCQYMQHLSTLMGPEGFTLFGTAVGFGAGYSAKQIIFGGTETSLAAGSGATLAGVGVAIFGTGVVSLNQANYMWSAPGEACGNCGSGPWIDYEVLVATNTESGEVAPYCSPSDSLERLWNTSNSGHGWLETNYSTPCDEADDQSIADDGYDELDPASHFAWQEVSRHQDIASDANSGLSGNGDNDVVQVEDDNECDTYYSAGASQCSECPDGHACCTGDGFLVCYGAN